MQLNKCPRCDHDQDISGGKIAQRCEACGFSLSYGNPWKSAVLAILALVLLWYAKMPTWVVAVAAIWAVICVIATIKHSVLSRKAEATIPPYNSVEQVPLVYTPKDLKKNLPVVADKKIFIQYKKLADGPQTAARLVGETFSNYGARIVGTRQDADVSVGIYLTLDGRAGFLVSDPSRQRLGRRAECGPHELTTAIMTGVCEILGQIDLGTSHLRQDIQRARINQALDQASEKNINEMISELNCSADEIVDAVLDSLADLNRKISLESQTGNFGAASNTMSLITRRVHILGQLKNPRSIPVILDALGDAAQAYQFTRLSQALQLREAASDALVLIGSPAINPIQENLHDPRPAIRQALEVVYARLTRRKA